MKTVIVGCGRVGSVLADSFDRAGHEVIIIDTSTSAFDRLPEAHREVIVLAKVMGLSRGEIAAQMGRTEIAVRTLLSRALAQLAGELVEGG